MASVTRTVIHLGNSADGIPTLDPNGTGAAENASALNGTTFTTATMSMNSVTYEDGDSNGFIDFDDYVGAGGDYLTYDVGGGSVSETIDQSVWYDVTITRADSSQFSTSALVFQTPSGETFFTEFSGSLDNLSILSIRIDSVNVNSFGRHATNNSLDNTSTVCFAQGTLIQTSHGGWCKVEALRPEQNVMTLGLGPMPVAAIYRVIAGPKRPVNAVAFAPGSLGEGVPRRKLAVTAQHRLLCRSRLVERMFNTSEIMIPAHRLTGLPGVRAYVAAPDCCFYHVELRQHAILFAEDAPAESLHLGEEAHKALPASIKPLVKSQSSAGLARFVPPPAQQKRFVARMLKNGHRVLERGYADAPRNPA